MFSHNFFFRNYHYIDLLQYCVKIKYGRVTAEKKTGREILEGGRFN